MFIKSLAIAALLCASFTSKAQDYYHGLGAQVNYGLYSLSYTSPSSVYNGTASAAVPGIFYKASLAFDVSRSTNFAISSYPFLGLNANFNSQTGGSGAFGVELPILAEFYFGDLDDPCFFLGAGFSAAFLASSDVFGGATAGPVVGPQLELGGQFNFRDKLIGLRFAYTYGVNNTKNIDSDITIVKDTRSMFSFGGYYLLGQ